MSALRRLLSHPHGRVGLLGALVSALLASLGPWLAPYAPTASLAAPHAAPSAAHWLGADESGRDLLSRVLDGGAVVVLTATSAALLAVLLGVGLGTLAGWRGGAADRLIRGVADTLLSLPPLLLQLVIIGLVQPKGDARLVWMVFILAGTGWMGMARVTRTEVRALQRRGFVEAARGLGLTELQLLRHHVLPHLVPYALTWTAMAASQAILAEAALSFLGLGVQAPRVSWGGMIGDWGVLDPARELLPPALAIVLTSVSWALLADALRDVLDLRTRSAPETAGPAR